MPSRYRVAEGHVFHYPADPVSLRLIKENGGMHGASQLDEDAKRKIKIKTVTSGADCSDMPQPALGIHLERGWVVEEQAVEKDGD